MTLKIIKAGISKEINLWYARNLEVGITCNIYPFKCIVMAKYSN